MCKNNHTRTKDALKTHENITEYGLDELEDDDIIDIVPEEQWKTESFFHEKSGKELTFFDFMEKQTEATIICSTNF